MNRKEHQNDGRTHRSLHLPQFRYMKADKIIIEEHEYNDEDDTRRVVIIVEPKLPMEQHNIIGTFTGTADAVVEYLIGVANIAKELGQRIELRKLQPLLADVVLEV